ncbi:hypothetical protein BGX23_003668, partial [Mortierella sp. AD031]
SKASSSGKSKQSSIPRYHYDQLQYRIKWRGYPEVTWQPHTDTDHCQDLVRDFHAHYPDKVGPEPIKPKPKPNLKSKILSLLAPKEEDCHELGS